MNPVPRPLQEGREQKRQMSLCAEERAPAPRPGPTTSEIPSLSCQKKLPSRAVFPAPPSPGRPDQLPASPSSLTVLLQVLLKIFRVAFPSHLSMSCHVFSGQGDKVTYSWGWELGCHQEACPCLSVWRCLWAVLFQEGLKQGRVGRGGEAGAALLCQNSLSPELVPLDQLCGLELLRKGKGPKK